MLSLLPLEPTQATAEGTECFCGGPEAGEPQPISQAGTHNKDKNLQLRPGWVSGVALVPAEGLQRLGLSAVEDRPGSQASQVRVWDL